MLCSERLGRRSRSDRFRRKRGCLYSKALGRRSRVAVVVTVLLCDCVARGIFIFLSNNCFADNPRRLRLLIWLRNRLYLSPCTLMLFLPVKTLISPSYPFTCYALTLRSIVR